MSIDFEMVLEKGCCKHIKFSENRIYYIEAYRYLCKLVNTRKYLVNRIDDKKTPFAYPKCNYCENVGDYACLECSFFACDDHFSLHWIESTHFLYMYFTNCSIYCTRCCDYVYDNYFENEKYVIENLDLADIHSYPVKSKYDMVEFETNQRLYQSIQNLKEKPKSFSKLNTSNLYGIKGIYQMGNTCYMSCIIQCLTHTLPIKTYFLLENHVNTLCENRTKNPPCCLLCAIDIVLSHMYSTDEKPCDISNILYIFWNKCKSSSSYNSLASYNQNDAHEFLLSFLDIIHGELTNNRNNNSTNCECIVHSTFQGQLRSDMECCDCHQITSSYEVTMEISLEIPKSEDAIDLYKCLNQFTDEEVIQKSCSNCGGNKSIKKTFLSSLPTVLCLHITRFQYGEIKIPTKLNFPINGLNMYYYYSSNSVSNDISLFLYDLYGIVVHVGNLTGGHYYCYIRENDVWYCCNDESVKISNIDRVLSEEPYLLFYIRRKCFPV